MFSKVKMATSMGLGVWLAFLVVFVGLGIQTNIVLALLIYMAVIAVAVFYMNGQKKKEAQRLAAVPLYEVAENEYVKDNGRMQTVKDTIIRHQNPWALLFWVEQDTKTKRMEESVSAAISELKYSVQVIESQEVMPAQKARAEEFEKNLAGVKKTLYVLCNPVGFADFQPPLAVKIACPRLYRYMLKYVRKANKGA